MQGDALRLALQLLHTPAQARSARSQPLPNGVLQLLRLAANDTEAIAEAVSATRRTEAVLVESAAFFIEQVMWFPEADSYRVLGVTPDASTAELKRHMSLLMLWLRPDVGMVSDRSVFVRRVTAAWNDLKTPERRAHYDTEFKKRPLLRTNIKPKRPNHQHGMRDPAAARTKRPFLRRVLALLFPRPPVS